jgi:signal transduction histidine kinase
MEQVMQRNQDTATIDGAERKRLEAVVQTLATVGCRGESVAEVAHDARNMVTALGLYCDLLEEPGVLSAPFAHYGNELRLVAAASRQLVEKLVALGGRRHPSSHPGLSSSLTASPEIGRGTTVAASLNTSSSIDTVSTGRSSLTTGTRSAPERGPNENTRHGASGRWELMPTAPIESLAAELLANHNLLAALAGPMIVLTVDVAGGARGVRLTGEDLTRVLVNLVKNAAEAMPEGGRIQIELHERAAESGTVESLALTIEDNGPGIPEDAMEQIFTSGYTTRAKGTESRGSWPVVHRGMGLSISRSIVESAGGCMTAANCAGGGAQFEIDLPVRTR